MKAVSVFLEELQKRIDSTALQMIDFENKKNTLLEIDNIILKYGLNKRNISADDLLKIDSAKIDDLYLIIDFIYGNNTDEIKDIATRNINNIRNNPDIINHLYLIPNTNNITNNIEKYINTIPVSGSKNASNEGINVKIKHLNIIVSSFLNVLV